jgi:hypothetical protein
MGHFVRGYGDIYHEAVRYGQLQALFVEPGQNVAHSTISPLRHEQRQIAAAFQEVLVKVAGHILRNVFMHG